MSNREFLSQVWGEIKGNVPIAFATGLTPAGKLQVNEFHWFHLPDQFEQAVALADSPQKGYRRNKYFGPHAYGNQVMRDHATNEPILRDGKEQISRSTTNSQMVQVISIDSDTFPWKSFRAEPSIHLETSPGRGHDHFVLDKPVESKRASKLSRQMVEAHKHEGLDPSTWAANKVVRVPDSENTKDTANPWKITTFETGLIYSIEELEALYADVEVKSTAAGVLNTYSDMDESKFPDGRALMMKIPSSERRLNDLLFKNPKLGEQGWRSQQRWALLGDLLRHGFTTEEATAIAWITPSAKKWREDGAGRSIGGLYGEAKKIEIEIKAEQSALKASTAAPAIIAQREAEDVLAAGRINLLSGNERIRVAERLTADKFYYQFVEDRVKKVNHPYHRNNFAVYLSTAFGDVGFMPRPDGKMPLNIYTFSIGPSGTGKTEADRVWLMWTGRLYPKENILLAGESSKNSFLEQLIEKRSKVCVFNVDEADGFIAELVAKAGGTVGLQESITKVYDGPIPALGRVGNKELNIPHGSWTSLSDKLFGTPSGLMKVLTRDMFTKGFLARHMWAVGEESAMTEDMMEERQVEGEVEATYENMPTFFAQLFNQHRAHYRKHSRVSKDGRFPVLLTNEALERLQKAKWAVVQHFDGHPDKDVIIPSMRRSFDVMRKMASLFAMSEGKDYADTSHVLIAIHMVEQWLDDLEQVVGMIAENYISRACDDLETFIASYGIATPGSVIYRRRKGELKFDTDKYLQQLQVQGRIEMLDREPGEESKYRIRQDRTN